MAKKETMKQIDAKHHLHPFSNNQALAKEGVRVIVKGKGIYLWDADGNKIIDAMAGLWCVNVGYGQKKLAKVAQKQMETLPYYNTFFKTTHPAVIKLTQTLFDGILPKGFNHVFYTNSGSESIDTMIRMVRHYWASVGKPEKQVLIGRWNGYHGSTLAGASMGGMKGMHKQGGLVPNIAHIDQPWWYGLGGSLSADEFGLKAASWLEEKILEIGADKVAAFVGEPIQGAGGVIIPPKTYWPKIQEICKKYNILLVADEVICGFGRTGKWFGHQTMGFTPDVFTTAKGLSSGYQPIGAVFFNDKVAKGILKGGELEHGFTYSGHPVAAAVAQANLEMIRDGILDKVQAKTAAYFQKRWRDVFSQFSFVDDVRGVGMVAGFTLVKDKRTRTLFENTGEVGLMCRDIFFRNNLIMRACGDHIVCSPPLVITRSEIDKLLAVAEKSLFELEEKLQTKLALEKKNSTVKKAPAKRVSAATKIAATKASTVAKKPITRKATTTAAVKSTASTRGRALAKTTTAAKSTTPTARRTPAKSAATATKSATATTRRTATKTVAAKVGAQKKVDSTTTQADNS
ncbi:aspartate aminotransferase family protein [Neisseria sp. Ec49-e6-T10]|uniref:aspartate aminotransferase family protein n=1 Tax=Neisseria sp. Ec49-e6-T10 TaxID=3140744 RepID=UPI003EC0CDDE